MAAIADKNSTFNIFYYMALVIYFVTQTLENSMIGQQVIPHWLINLICVGFIAIKIIGSRRIKVNQLFLWLIGGTLFVFLYVRYKYTTPLIIVILLLGAEGCSADTIAKLHFYIVGSIVALLAIMSQVGIVEDRIFYQRGGNAIRHSMGMTYVTIWAGVVGFLLIEYIFIHRKNLRIRHFVIYLAIMIYTYVMTYTRVELIINVLFLLIVLFYQRIKNIIPSKALVIAFPASALIIYALQAIYMARPASLQSLDSLLSNRFTQTANVLNQYPITLMGNYLKMQGFGTVDFDSNIGYFFIDSFYLNYLVQFGVLFMIFILIVITFISYRLYKENKIFFLYILALTAIHGIIISLILVPYFDPLYMIGYALLTDSKTDSDEPVFQLNVKLRFSRSIVNQHSF